MSCCNYPIQPLIFLNPVSLSLRNLYIFAELFLIANSINLLYYFVNKINAPKSSKVTLKTQIN
ncbi:hypothetical protein DS2_00990 [Catenovulum agarivorans DS-2]|uniref:Uncharacterized protein n=1 Tax=Catenovulum agarivorans DS-2 TaxID=1328313 RepID=W7QWZ4_9ALTE|nr:hypothetical protein DS2_00990 [Catenovulum agarivorans DS-2]